MMAENATNENLQFRLAAVQTLGQTMEFIELYGKTLNNDQIGRILHSTVLNIDQTNIPLTRIAIKALSRAIPLTSENFAVEAQRNFIIDGLFKAVRMNDIEIEETAL